MCRWWAVSPSRVCYKASRRGPGAFYGVVLWRWTATGRDQSLPPLSDHMIHLTHSRLPHTRQINPWDAGLLAKNDTEPNDWRVTVASQWWCSNSMFKIKSNEFTSEKWLRHRLLRKDFDARGCFNSNPNRVPF